MIKQLGCSNVSIEDIGIKDVITAVNLLIAEHNALVCQHNLLRLALQGQNAKRSWWSLRIDQHEGVRQHEIMQYLNHLNRIPKDLASFQTLKDYEQYDLEDRTGVSGPGEEEGLT